MQNLVRIGLSAAELLRTSVFKMAAVRHLRFGMTSQRTTHDLFDGPNILLKLHVDRVNILRDIAIFYIWPVWLEIAYSRPFWGSFGGYDGDVLGIGYRCKGSKNYSAWATR